MAGKAKDIALSEAENEEIFQKEILPEYITRDKSGNENPVAVLLGGQPGSGKSGLLKKNTKLLSEEGGVVPINGDDLRDFHPQYKKLQETDPLNAARLTDHDSGRWVEKLIQAAAERKIHLIIEGTFRNPAVPEKTANMLHEAGYKVEAHLLAVESELIWLGCNQRYESMMDSGSPRFTTKQAHDAAVEGIPVIVENLQNRNIVDRLHIENRSGQTLYENSLQAGKWQSTDKAVDVIRNVYSKGLDPEQAEAAIKTGGGRFVSVGRSVGLLLKK